jgi:hypothetical protein
VIFAIISSRKNRIGSAYYKTNFVPLDFVEKKRFHLTKKILEIYFIYYIK